MSRLDEIAARDARFSFSERGGVIENDADPSRFGAFRDAARDRRYLLGLVREAREALAWMYDEAPSYHRRIDDLLARLTEGSDRT